MLEAQNGYNNSPVRKFTRSMDVFFVPAHGFTEKEYELGFFKLRRGFAQAGFNLVTKEWINGENTNPSDQVNYLHRVIRNSHELHSFEPFALAGHSRGAQVVLEEARRTLSGEFADRLTGVILLSPAPYYEPVFTGFKKHADRYPSDYSKFPPELKSSLEGLELPPLPKDLPIEIFSGKQETPFNHQVEGVMLNEYRGHSAYHEVQSERRWHPYLVEYAPVIAEYGKGISGINEAVQDGLPAGVDETQLHWIHASGVQFARLPRGRVGIRDESIGTLGSFPPGIWVNFLDNSKNGNYDNVAA